MTRSLPYLRHLRWRRLASRGWLPRAPRLWALLRETDAATAVEYAVMMTLIVAACIGAIRLVGQAGASSLSASAAEIEHYFPAGS